MKNTGESVLCNHEVNKSETQQQGLQNDTFPLKPEIGRLSEGSVTFQH